MSWASAAHPATVWRERANPVWHYRRETPRLTDEGDEVVLSIRVANWNTGSKIQHWMAGGKSLASPGHWLRSWHDVFQKELEANGCTYVASTRSSTPPVLGTLAGLITVGPGYQGQTMFFRNRSRKNKRDDAPLNADGTPGYREMQILLATQGAKGSPELAFNGTAGKFVGGNLVQVRDTSRSPAGTPTLRMRMLDPDGAPSPLALFEGDEFACAVETANIIPGTAFKIYVANEGRDALVPSFRAQIKAAGEAAGCEVFVPGYKEAMAGSWYNGGAITFTETYDDTRPVVMPFRVKLDNEEQGTRQIDFVGQIVAEGDASEFDEVRGRGDWDAAATYRRGDWVTYVEDGGRYVYISETASSGRLPTDGSRWRPYVTTQASSTTISMQFRDTPPRFWELRATTDGAVITYTIQGPTGAVGDNVALASAGAPPGFDAALSEACSGEAGVLYAGGRLIAQATEREASSVTFTVPHAGAGKHTLRLSDRQGPSWIVIGDACVYLTAPALPDDPHHIVGVNLASGGGGHVRVDGGPSVYGKHYVYNSEPDKPEPQRHQEMNYYWAKGVRIIRLPFKWERVQSELFGPLYYGDVDEGPWTGGQDMRRIDELVHHWTVTLGGWVLLDVHNYMGYEFADGGGTKLAYDNPRLDAHALIDLWVRLANRYADNPHIWFGLMNEPSGDKQTPVRVRDTMHAVVNAIRARTPALNKILVAGASYSSASNWVAKGQAAAYEDFYDPAGNFAYEPHTYFDFDSSGTVGTCVAGAQANLHAITAWARSEGVRLFLGECAGGDPAISGQETCGAVVPAAYKYMSDNRDVWLGWTTWAAGRFWRPTYEFLLDPPGKQFLNLSPEIESGQLKMLLPYLAA